MARGTVTPVLMQLNGGTVGTSTAVDAVNNLAVTSADGLWRRNFVQITNTSAGVGTVAIEPGVYGVGPAFLGFAGTAAAAGTTYVVIAAAGTAFFALEGARYVQADGLSIYLDFTPAGFTGAVYAYELPANL